MPTELPRPTLCPLTTWNATWMPVVNVALRSPYRPESSLVITPTALPSLVFLHAFTRVNGLH